LRRLTPCHSQRSWGAHAAQRHNKLHESAWGRHHLIRALSLSCSEPKNETIPRKAHLPTHAAPPGSIRPGSANTIGSRGIHKTGIAMRPAFEAPHPTSFHATLTPQRPPGRSYQRSIIAHKLLAADPKQSFCPPLIQPPNQPTSCPASLLSTTKTFAGDEPSRWHDY